MNEYFTKEREDMFLSLHDVQDALSARMAEAGRFLLKKDRIFDISFDCFYKNKLVEVNKVILNSYGFPNVFSIEGYDECLHYVDPSLLTDWKEKYYYKLIDIINNDEERN